MTHSSKNTIENHFDTLFELDSTLETRVKRQLLEEVRSHHAGTPGTSQRPGPCLCAKPLVGDAPFAVVLPDVLIDDALFNAELGLRQGGTGRTDVEHSFCRRPYILNCVEP